MVTTMNRIKRILRRKYLNLLYRIDAEAYKKKYPRFLKALGVRIPDDYRDGGHGFIHPSAQLDGNDFSLISIGKNTTISADVIILTHDYSIGKGLQYVNAGISGRFLKPVSIGENSFIGIRSILLPGASVGNNVIIGAGSVVSGCIPDGVVAAGNPAKPICSIEEWTKKHMQKQDFVTLPAKS